MSVRANFAAVNANLGLKVNRSIYFSCVKMFSTSFVLCTLRLLKLCLFFCKNEILTLPFLFISVHILFTFYLTLDHFTLVRKLIHLFIILVKAYVEDD